MRNGRLLAGRYVVHERVGAGAMGTVHRAVDRRERREVAVKLLRDPTGSLLHRFVREQSLRIDHPHVVAPLGWAGDDDHVLLVMELVRGGTLADLRARGPLPEGCVAVLLAQLLSALAAVHAAGLVHRDVKPANVLLEVTGTGLPHLRLGDLGVAWTPGSEDPGGPGGFAGTLGYAAPEARAGAAPDPRHDLYAAGVLARRCLATGVLAGVAGVAPALAPVIAALTDPDPSRRPTDAEEALAMLRGAIDLDTAWDPRLAPDVHDVLGDRHGAGLGRARLATTCLAGSALSSLGAALLATWP